MSGPQLAVGDTWTYHTNTTLGAGFRLDGDATIRVIGVGPVTVEGAIYDAVRMSVVGGGTAAGTFSTQFGSTPASGNWVLTGQEALESAGLKVVSSVLDLEANGTLHTQPVPIQFQLSVQNTTTYRLGDDAWRFPLGIGNSTVVASEMNFSEDFRLFYGFPTTPIRTAGRVWWNLTYALENQVAVDTPAGHFGAYRIRETYPGGTYSLLFYAPATGNYARTETHNDTSEVATTELTSYRYQALEAPRFLSLTTDQWAITATVAAAGLVAVVWWLRGRRKPAPPQPGPPPAT